MHKCKLASSTKQQFIAGQYVLPTCDCCCVVLIQAMRSVHKVLTSFVLFNRAGLQCAMFEVPGLGKHAHGKPGGPIQRTGNAALPQRPTDTSDDRCDTRRLCRSMSPSPQLGPASCSCIAAGCLTRSTLSMQARSRRSAWLPVLLYHRNLCMGCHVKFKFKLRRSCSDAIQFQAQMRLQTWWRRTSKATSASFSVPCQATGRAYLKILSSDLT